MYRWSPGSVQTSAKPTGLALHCVPAFICPRAARRMTLNEKKWVGFTCSASIGHSLVSISLKSMEHSSFLRAPTDFVPHKKLDASKFGHIAILWKNMSISSWPPFWGPASARSTGPRTLEVPCCCATPVKSSRAGTSKWADVLYFFVSAHFSKALEMRTSCISYFLDVYFLLIVSDWDKHSHFQRHF